MPSRRDERYARRVASHLQSWWRDNPFPDRSALDQRHRNRNSPDLLGMDPPASRWLGRDRQALREKSAIHRPAPSPSGVAGGPAEPRLIGEQPSGRGGRRAIRGSQRVPGLQGEPRLASASRRMCCAAKRWRRRFRAGSIASLPASTRDLVLELFLAAAIEGELAGSALGPVVWERIRAMTDALGGDHGRRGNPPASGRWRRRKRAFARRPGIQSLEGSAFDRPRAFWRLALVASSIRTRPANAILDARDQCAVSAGHASGPPSRSVCRRRARLLARQDQAETEIWCRCDHGPHGFLSIAAHAHADALAIELRVNDTEVLADPGTYCYHGEREWRDYFRSTIGHNTLELLSQDQSVSGGPFLWTSHAQSKLIEVSGLDAVRRPQRGRQSTRVMSNAADRCINAR